ncbi:helix-turn-helix transcriptional regulator [Clostridium intestinale]|uniref:helix-turn-helix transcriptional regulator n=1 Tax=Clostridium intestinale TaxID=36845 RepID=UPI001FAE52B6|nr:helix-turn-helix transcriptional regulator [Clostridium intestinale]
MDNSRSNKLLQYRTCNNLKQKEVAKAVGVSTSYYGMIETGVRNPNLEIAHKIAKYFNTSIENIFFESLNN